jgi:hypothetical protein
MCPERSITHVSGLDNRVSGALERTRTSDPQLRKLMLYPLSYERVTKEDTRQRFPDAGRDGTAEARNFADHTDRPQVRLL